MIRVDELHQVQARIDNLSSRFAAELSTLRRNLDAIGAETEVIVQRVKEAVSMPSCI